MKQQKDGLLDFITLADLPPDPTSDATLKEYAELGFNVCLLTEDHVKLLKDGTFSSDYKAAIERIGANGMEVWIRNMYNDADYFECAEKKEGSNYGDAYTLEPRNITTEFSEFPSVTGFYMADEAFSPDPGSIAFRWKHRDAEKFASFDKMVKLVEWRNKYYPSAFFHVNHVPSQSYDHFFPHGTEIYDYKDFLNNYIDNVLAEVHGNRKDICLDNYPFVGENYIEADYLYDLLTGATVVKEYNERVGAEESALFGICLQTFHVHGMAGEGRHRDIYSENEITFQMFVGLAMGARLFEYFCYRSYPGGLDGILRLDGSKRIYDLVKKANDRFLSLGAVTHGYTWKGAFACAGEKICDNAAAFIKAKPLFTRSAKIAVSSEYDVVVGCFEKDGKAAYAIVNYTDPIRNLTNVVSVKTAFDGATIYYGDKTERAEKENGWFRLTLRPGCGIFIVSN